VLTPNATPAGIRRALAVAVIAMASGSPEWLLAVAPTSRIDLGQLIFMFMLRTDESKPDWGMRSDGPLRWSNAGVESGTSGELVRRATAHISVGGRTFWVLRTRREPLDWDVIQTGTKFGIAHVDFLPKDACFGVAASGCGFTWNEVLAKTPVLRSQKLCESPRMGEKLTLFQVSAPGKKPARVLYALSTGSGGSSNWVELWYGWPGEADNLDDACTWVTRQEE